MNELSHIDMTLGRMTLRARPSMGPPLAKAVAELVRDGRGELPFAPGWRVTMARSLEGDGVRSDGMAQMMLGFCPGGRGEEASLIGIFCWHGDTAAKAWDGVAAIKRSFPRFLLAEGEFGSPRVPWLATVHMPLGHRLPAAEITTGESVACLVSWAFIPL